MQILVLLWKEHRMYYGKEQYSDSTTELRLLLWLFQKCQKTLSEDTEGKNQVAGELSLMLLQTFCALME